MELLNTPGYLATVDHINSYPLDELRLLSHRSIKYVKCQSSVLQADDIKTRLDQIGNVDVSEAVIRNVVNTLTLIFRRALCLSSEANKAEAFAEELKRAALNPEAVAALCAEWAAAEACDTGRTGTAALAANLLSIGNLVGLDWSAGIATRGKHLRNLNTAYVTLAFQISNPNGSVEHVTVELNMVEFHDFSDKMKEIKEVLQKVG